MMAGFGRVFAPLALALSMIVPAHASNGDLEAQFDSVIGASSAPRDFTAHYDTNLQRQIAQLAADGRGRVGVAAIDLSDGRQIAVLGNERFPLASTSKIAIAATFLEGVDQGRWRLDDSFPMMLTPTREGQVMSGRQLIELAITRSSNEAADGLLRVVGGPRAVTDWVHRTGIREFSLDRYITTLVQQDNSSSSGDTRDSATPLAMVSLVKGLHDGRWLSPSSRAVLLGAMGRCKTGPQRIPGQMPAGVAVAHKTGSLYNNSSDVGIVTDPDGHAFAVAIYVTGGGGDHRYRFEKISQIARAVYDGYQAAPAQVWASATYDQSAAGH